MAERQKPGDSLPTPLHQGKAGDVLFFVHDIFNIISMAAILMLDFVYLYRCTNWQQVGTNLLGAEQRPLFNTLWFVFMSYMVIDTVWVALFPRCAPAGAVSIIAHHVITIVYIMIPYLIPQMHWHMGIVLLVEINTLLLTLRRNVPPKSLIHHLLHVFFLVSWGALRVVIFPAFTIFLYWEHTRYTSEVQTAVNGVLLGLLLQILLTGLGFKWTYDLVQKTFFVKDTKDK